MPIPNGMQHSLVGVGFKCQWQHLAVLAGASMRSHYLW